MVRIRMAGCAARQARLGMEHTGMLLCVWQAGQLTQIIPAPL
jgi:hypothetical protein